MAQATTFSVATLAVVRSHDCSRSLKLKMLAEDLARQEHPLTKTTPMLFDIVDYYEEGVFSGDAEPSAEPSVEMLVDTIARDFDDRQRITIHSAMVMRARIGSIHFRLSSKSRSRRNGNRSSRAA